MESRTSFPDEQLINSLHQWLDLCREAIARGDPWSRPIVQVLTILRQLLDARVAVLRVDWPLEALFHISTGSQASEDQLSTDSQFIRLCQLLFEVPQPLLIADALEGREFVNPFLRSQFPNLSFLTAAWSMSGAVIQLAFFSDELGHFSLDHRMLVDYFGSQLVSVLHAEVENDALCMVQRG